MIAPNRFVARSSDRDLWLEARKQGVTATAVAKAASGPAGFRDQLEARRNPVDVEVNAFMAWGTFMEPIIAAWVKDEFGIMPNEWLIAHADAPRFLATPDGLSLDHTLIAEIKTMGKALDSPTADHVRQMQWQMFVTGAEKCLYAWQLRANASTGFVPGWLEPRSLWVERDEKMIGELVKVAVQLLNDGNGNG